MPDFNDRGPGIEAGRQAEGDPDLVRPEMAHDTTAFPLALDKQAVTPGLLTEGSHHLNGAAVEDDSLSDYYTNNENAIDDILSKQEEEAYNVLASL